MRHHRQRKNRIGGKKDDSLLVPKIFSLHKNYSATVRLVTELRKRVLDKRRSVFIDFREIEEAELAATLYLTAELNRCWTLLNKMGRDQWEVNGNYPKDDSIHAQLVRVGFYNILGLPPAHRGQKPEGDSAKRILPFRTGTTVDSESAERFVIELCRDSDLLSPANQRDLQGCLVEAMANAIDHAYKFGRELPHAIARRWWLTGSADSRVGEVGIVILDQGHGIPRTLDRTLLEWIGRFTADSPDSMMIEAATQLHRTSTRLRGRGKGFATMMKFVDRCDDGELLIYSSRGSYLYNRPDGSVRSDSKLPLGGTLVQWRVKHKVQIMDLEVM